MPVGTQATVKAVTPHQLAELGASIVLSNAYHLYLRPGTAIVKDLGGLHGFMSWPRPILTDSGGFQVFSLGHLRKVTEEGVVFRSHHDGSEHFFTPETVMRVEEDLGADIIMAFDECAPYPCDQEYARQAMERTHRWSARCLAAKRRDDQWLFGIVQGGIYPELRRESASFLASLDFPGYAVGGLSLGEPKATTYAILAETLRWLPTDKPRYLMGVGSPEDLIECVERGVDMFDAVLPTRIARNGALFTRTGRRNIRNASFRRMDAPVDPTCDCYTCTTFSAAYLHHLFKTEELLGYTLASVHNLRFLVKLMEEIRAALDSDTFPALRDDFLARYVPTNEEVRVAQKAKWEQAQRAKGEGR